MKCNLISLLVALVPVLLITGCQSTGQTRYSPETQDRIKQVENSLGDWVKGYGWADVSEKRPVTEKTLFQAASISKSLNGVGVLKLVQDGKLDLHTDINQYLTSWKFPYDTVSKGKLITLSALLSHSAGLTIHGFPGYAQGDTLPAVIQREVGKGPYTRVYANEA